MNLGDSTLIFYDFFVSLSRFWIFMMSNLGTKGSMGWPFLSTRRVYSNSVPRWSYILIFSLFSSTRLIHCCNLLCRITYLEHVLSHSAAVFVFETFVLKIEFNLTLLSLAWFLNRDHIKVNFNSAFWDWLRLQRLWKFYLIAAKLWDFNLREDVCVSAEELDLFNVNFGPAIYNFLHDLLRFVFSHFYNGFKL